MGPLLESDRSDVWVDVAAEVRTASEADKSVEVSAFWLETAGIAWRERTVSPAIGRGKRMGMPALTVPRDVVCGVVGLNQLAIKLPLAADKSTRTVPPAGR